MSQTVRSFAANSLAFAWRYRVVLCCVAGGLALYLYFIWGLSTNPPGIYLDESGGAYNAYTIAKTGRNEFGEWFPVYPQFYTESNVQYSNPVHIYIMALMYLFVPPSTWSARVCCATMTFLAALLLGFLAKNISGRRLIGIIVTVTAALTPWLFEASRLILEASVFPLALALFLFLLYNTLRRGEWKWVECVLVGFSLGMITYSYTIGRFLAPMLGIGMLMLVTNWRSLFGVVKTGTAYAVSLIPFLWVYFSNNSALTRRFNTITWVNSGDPWSVFFDHFRESYLTDVSLDFLLEKGDPLLRHHIPGGGELLAATFALAMVGIVVIVFRHWRERWWWFIIYGLLLSVVPGALTVQRYHALRTIGFPVFLLVLTIPAMMWLLGPAKERTRQGRTFAEWLDELPERFINAVIDWRKMLFNRKLFGSIVLAIVLILTLNQAYDFQVRFEQIGPTRYQPYDQAYLQVLNRHWPSPSGLSILKMVFGVRHISTRTGMRPSRAWIRRPIYITSPSTRCHPSARSFYRRIILANAVR
jgi:4-amino-4-deoxy-L-arabinose transferase-like glycosyltransferase